MVVALLHIMQSTQVGTSEREDWLIVLDEQWCNLAKFTVVSFHGANGQPIADAGLADNGAILRPTGDMNVGLNAMNHQVDNILYAHLISWINLRDVTPEGTCVIRLPINHFIKLPQSTCQVLNGMNQPTSVSTFAGPADLGTMTNLRFEINILNKPIRLD